MLRTFCPVGVHIVGEEVLTIVWNGRVAFAVVMLVVFITITQETIGVEITVSTLAPRQWVIDRLVCRALGQRVVVEGDFLQQYIFFGDLLTRDECIGLAGWCDRTMCVDIHEVHHKLSNQQVFAIWQHTFSAQVVGLGTCGVGFQ